MNYITVNSFNIYLVNDFLRNTSSKHFRYYTKRKPETTIPNHLYTVIGIKDNIPICYGHIDYSNNKHWIGICVSDNYINNKHGTHMLNHLLEWCKNKIDSVYLSVDIDNDIAIHLYKKFGFIVSEYQNNIMYMKKILSLHNTVKLDCSYGEALDKLSILEIKLEKIKDERRNFVQLEYDILHKSLNNVFNDDIRYFYRILKRINQRIWDIQERYRSCTHDIYTSEYTNKFKMLNQVLSNHDNNHDEDVDNDTSKNDNNYTSKNDNNYKSMNDTDNFTHNTNNDICNIILCENDRRFRIKQKINNYLNSHIKEQKGYNVKKAFVMLHFGLGDIINCIGLIRYLSTLHDEIHVVCRKIYHDNIKLLYANDSSIKFYICDDIYDISPKYGFDIYKFIDIMKDYDFLYLGGMHRFNFYIGDKLINGYDNDTIFMPFSLYDDCGINITAYRDYNYIPRIYESKKLYNEVIKICDKYIIVHEHASIGKMFDYNDYIEIDKNNTLIINIEENVYDKEHKYYEIAEKCIKQPMLHYVDLIENSLLNIISDSCLYCLALHLNIKTKHNYSINRGIYVFFEKEYGFIENIHPRFITLKYIENK